MVARAIKPDYALGNHTASLGLAFYTAELMPQFRGGHLLDSTVLGTVNHIVDIKSFCAI